MSNTTSSLASIKEKFEYLKPLLNERSLRIWCATEAKAYGRGGKALVHKATGVSWPTINKGLDELSATSTLDPTAIRRKGGGRKRLTQKDNTILADLDKLIEPAIRGNPENPLRWTSKSTIKLAAELRLQGHQISQRSVHRLLLVQNFSLQSNRKRNEGKQAHPDRDAQFQYINEQAILSQANNCPVLSVDAKKKENIGLYKNNGQEWFAKGQPMAVNTYDFPDKKQGKGAPYGVFDIGKNQGWVSVGISSDTAQFAVESIRSWWNLMGKALYQDASHIMITADCGGSNGNRVGLWKYELQVLSNELNKPIKVCHFPPGTSKWNKIEHRLFSYITQNWRGRPLVDLQTIVELISNTTTKTGLIVKARIDTKVYQKGRKLSKEELSSINLQAEKKFHPEWNYTLVPNIPKI